MNGGGRTAEEGVEMATLKIKGLFLIAALAALVLGGCASVPMASLSMDNEAKNFTAPASASRIYIYRSESMGGAIPMTVSLDGKTLGQTGPKTYFMIDVAPGQHKVESFTENVASLTLQTNPGKAYYVWQEVKMGMWAARSALHEVPEEQGQKGVRESKMAASAGQ